MYAITRQLITVSCWFVLGAHGDGTDSPSAAQGSRERGPAFAIESVDGVLRPYSRSTVSDEWIDGQVESVGDEQWELVLTVKDAAVAKVWFPWEPKQSPVGGTIDDDIVFYPYRTGVAEKASTLKEWDWWGRVYPGPSFSPLVVVADDSAGRIVAATNWPPIAVTPVYSLGRVGLRYDEELAAGSTRRFRALVAEVRGDGDRGVDPWRLAVDKYKAWLLPNLQQEGIHPVQYPETLRKVNGWMHVSLHWIPAFDSGVVENLRRLFRDHGDTLPWVQFWGQMSNYQRHPAEGRTARAVPPLKRDEDVGCCVPRPAIHSRYVPAIQHFAAEVIQAGGTIGYYSRPKPAYRPLTSPDSRDLQFLKSWIEANHRSGATAYYLDVLGARYFGDPLTVARMFGNDLPQMSVIEWPVDLYPTAFLISGSLWGGHRFSTSPGETPVSLGRTKTRVTFPRLGRYVLDDRIMFLGRSNGDFMWWGQYRGHGHWTERQAFLLGAKFDAPTMFKGQRGWIEPVNRTVQMIVDEWDRVGWWDRGPVYRDRVGVYDVPAEVDVRRFVDQDGVDLFVVDNPKARTGTHFVFNGRTVPVPRERLRIVELVANEQGTP